MTLYRKPAPYRKSQTYRGSEVVVPTVPPSMFGASTNPWMDAIDHQADTILPWSIAKIRDGATAVPWSQSRVHANAIVAAWIQAAAHGFDATLPWGAERPWFAGGRHPWNQATTNGTDAATPWEQFRNKLAAQVASPWTQGAAHGFDTLTRWGTLARYQAQNSNLWRTLIARGAHIALPWGFGHHFQSGYGDPWTNPPDDGTPLAFPDLPVYIMIPSITAVVISSGADLKPLSVTISGDIESYDWSLEMQIPASTVALVDPRSNTEPVEIRVTVNGYAWSFIVDGLTDNRRFNARTFTVRGGSRSRKLSDAWAPTSTLLEASDYNASQLADHVVASTGWTSIWDAGADWTVPGGTWTYQDLAPIAALQQLAASVGATLETDPDALNIRIRPYYPEKPWEWSSATPYATVPVAILDAASGDWQGGNNADGIYVYPKNSTSGAFVRITGSGGTNLIRMVVDDLLTDAGAQTQRGVQEIAKAGRKYRGSITIPLLPAPALPGLVPLRELIECTDESGATWRGQVMGVQIAANSNGGAVNVRQTLTIERQFR